MLKKMMEKLHCSDLFKKFGLFTNSEQEEKIEQEEKKSPSEWCYLIDGEEHRVSIFYDSVFEDYRICDLKKFYIYPESFESQDEALTFIYSKSTRIIGLITHDCVSIFK